MRFHSSVLHLITNVFIEGKKRKKWTLFYSTSYLDVRLIDMSESN